MMRRIVKGKEPVEWIAHRQTSGADYEPKKCLREALYIEQGGICAYCMQRLDNELQENIVTSNRIDHIKNRADHDELQLVYTNMVMSCKGYDKNNKDKALFSCDKKKGSNDIHFTPLETTFIESLSYKSDGKISSTNVIWQADMDTVLNLNNNLLKMNRVAVLKAIRTRLGSKKSWKTSEIKKLITNWDNRDADGLYAPFCGMIVWYLKKKLTAYDPFLNFKPVK